MVAIQCLTGFTIFFEQYYNSINYITYNNLDGNDCKRKCLSISRCNGFNYNWNTKKCLLILDTSFFPHGIEKSNDNGNSFYMKSVDTCDKIYNHFSDTNYILLVMFVIFIFGLIPFWILKLYKKIKRQNRIQRSMSGIPLLENRVPPPYEERESSVSETIDDVNANYHEDAVPEYSEVVDESTSISTSTSTSINSDETCE